MTTELRWTQNSTFRDRAHGVEAVGPGIYDVPDEMVDEYLDHRSDGWESAEEVAVNPDVFFDRRRQEIVNDLTSGAQDHRLSAIREAEPDDMDGFVDTTLAARDVAEEHDIDADEACRALWFAPDRPATTRGTPILAVEDAYRRIRGDGEVSRGDIDGDIGPYLTRLPGVVKTQGAWVFDGSAVEPATVPDDPTDPTEDELSDALDAQDIPEGPGRHRRNRMHVRRLFEMLRERGTATRGELVEECFNQSHTSKPTQGHFTDEKRWWNVIRPAFANLAFVAAPVRPDGEFVYLGTGGDGQ